MRERKQQLRRHLRARRQEVYGGAAGARRREQESARLVDHARGLIDQVEDAVATSSRAPMVAAFHPTVLEPEVMPLVRELAQLGARLVFPAADSHELEWITWDGGSEFVDSPGQGFGREPTGHRLGPAALAEADLVLAPAVAIDRSGTRLGHGAGYYDRALRHVRPATTVVGVIHPQELLEAQTLPRTDHDVPVPTALTAEGRVALITNDGR